MSISLEEKIQQTGSVIELLRSANGQAITGPKTGAEVTNWHDEQLSWRETCALADLSHHMTDITLKGPDAMKLNNLLLLIMTAISLATLLQNILMMAVFESQVMSQPRIGFGSIVTRVIMNLNINGTSRPRAILLDILKITVSS